MTFIQKVFRFFPALFLLAQATVIFETTVAFPMEQLCTDAAWEVMNSGGIRGTNGPIYQLLYYNGHLYVAGDFTHAGNSPASYIATWDGTSWDSIAPQPPGPATALAFDDAGNLYAGIMPTDQNDKKVMRYDGSSWISIGTTSGESVNTRIHALTFDDNGNLYAAGHIYLINNVYANEIARWDGAAWDSLGAGIAPGPVYDLAYDHAGNLYACGGFLQAGGIKTNRIAAWNGSVWSDLGTGAMSLNSNRIIVAVCDRQGDLYIAGEIDSMVGVNAGNIARWDGGAWSALGSGTNGLVSSLSFDIDGNLYAGGSFTMAGGDTSRYVAKWDGTSWSRFGKGLTGVPLLCCDSSGNLFAGGLFTGPGGIPGYDIVQWESDHWSTRGTGMDGVVFGTALDSSGNLYLCGTFTTIGGVAAMHIAKWDGSSWSALGSGIGTGINDLVVALATDSRGNVYAGGRFRRAGGNDGYNNIAVWNGSRWSALGSGTNNVVASIVCDTGGILYAGGAFTTAGGGNAKYVARWNGASWDSLGTGLNDTVFACALDRQGNLYVGGAFIVAGGDFCNYLAKWDGTSWSTHGTGVNTEVNAVACGNDGTVYAGGINSLSAWNNGAWTAITRRPSDTITVLACDQKGRLLVGGNRGVAAWKDNTWYTLGSGTNGRVHALALQDSTLFIGGGFFTAGNKSSPCIAKVHLPSAISPVFSRPRSADASWISISRTSDGIRLDHVPGSPCCLEIFSLAGVSLFSCTIDARSGQKSIRLPGAAHSIWICRLVSPESIIVTRFVR
jgi:hypothetical protein